MAKIITSYLTTDEVELEFDTEYRFIENEKYNKENDEEIINFSTEYSSELISKSKNQNSHIKLKRFGLRNALLLGSFWLGFLMPCACSHKEETEIVVESEESVNLENTTDEVTTIVEDNTEPEVSVEPETVVEPVEEVNPRDMKAVYGLDFDVPIYTEEEVEIAKENLQTKYRDYNAGYSLTEDQINAIKDDYYIANQDFFYQLYAMTKDMSREDCIQLHLDKNDKFYDSDKDWIIEIGQRGQIIITGNNFRFTKCHSHDDSAGPNTLLDVELLFVSSDAYVTIAGPDFYSDCRKDVFDNSANNMSNEKYNVSNLENIGYHNQEIDNLFVGFDNASDLSLNSNN